MKSVMNLFYRFLRLLGLLDEHPRLRKNIKRNRVFDDFSSDDETPVSVQRGKRFRWSDVDAIDNYDKRGKHSKCVRNEPVCGTSATYTTSTPIKSSTRTVPVDLPGLSKKPSSPLKKATPVIPIIDADLEQEEPYVANVQSKSENTRKQPSILHVDLDDEDNDEVVFVKEVATPQMKAKNSHVSDLLSRISEAVKPDNQAEYRELLQRIAKTIQSMAKEKSVGDGKLAANKGSFRPPQKTQINALTEFELDSDTHQNAGLEPIRISSTDSSDSDDDVEIVPPPSATTSSMKTNSAKKLEELSKNWLLELDSIYNNKQQRNQENNNDPRRVSDITSKVNSDQNIARSHGHDVTDASDDLLAKLASDYNIKELHNRPKIQKTHEKHDSRRPSDSTQSGNSEQNEAGSSKHEPIGDWLAKIDAKYFPKPRKALDRFDGYEFNTVPKLSDQNGVQTNKPAETVDRLSKFESKNKRDLRKSIETDTVQKESHTSPLETTKEWLKRIEAQYFPTQENLSNTGRKSDIVPKVNGEEDDVHSISLNASRVSRLRKEPDYKIDFLKTQENNDWESDKPKAKSEGNEARSYLPPASRDWLSKLEAQYKITPQNNQDNLNTARQKLISLSKENGEQSDSSTVMLDSTDDWLDKLRAKYDEVQHQKNTKGESSNENKSFAEERPSLTSKHKTEQQKKPQNADQEVNNLSVNSEENKACSLKFDTSEELMSKLGSLYSKYQKNTQEKSNESIEESDVENQPNGLPVLTPEQEEMLDEAFEPIPEDELLAERFNMRIHRRDLQTLSDLNWLNDEVINFYMNLIMQRSEDRNDLPRVYATNTFFYPKLIQSGQAGLRRWTRKVDIFAYDLFMVPVNIGNHWCLSIVDFRSRVIKYLDSRGMPNQECLDALLQYLTDEHRDKKRAVFDANGWKMTCITEIPQQMNGSDCGMFACTFAEFSSRDAPYSFTQAHMPYLRRKAALEILMGKLLL